MRHRITIRTALTTAAVALGIGGITTGIAVAGTPTAGPAPVPTHILAAAHDSEDDAAMKRMDQMMESMTRNLPADQRAEARRMHGQCKSNMSKH